MSRRPSRLHEGHPQKPGWLPTATSLNTAPPSQVKRYPKKPFPGIWDPRAGHCRPAQLLPVFGHARASANTSLSTSLGAQPAQTGSQQLNAALGGYCAPSSSEEAPKPLPSVCKANITTPQACLLSSEIAVFTMKTTDYKQRPDHRRPSNRQVTASAPGEERQLTWV